MNINFKFNHWVYLYILLLVILLFYNLDSWGVIETSEARYAEISREMFVSKDYLHPRLLGILHYHKPPVIYWITSIGYALFGVTEFGARFFLQIAFIIQLITIYNISNTLFKNERLNFFAVIIYSTLPIVLISIRGLTTDAYVNTFILLAIFTWLKYIYSRSPIFIYLTAFILSIGFLTKGPVAWIYAGSFIIGTLTLSESIRKHWIHVVVSTLIMIVISGSWNFYVIVENKQLADYFLIHHLVERFTDANSFHRSEPPWYYLIVLPGIMLTWFIIFAVGVVKVKIKEVPIIVRRIALFWILIPFIFFSIASSKLVLYILPLFGGIAILLAYLINNHANMFGEKTERGVTAALIIINTVFLITPFTNTLVLPVFIIIFPIISIAIITLIFFYKNFTSVNERLCYYTMIFTLTLIPFSSFLLAKNELALNGTLPITDWLKEKGMEDREIIVYDQLLPSLGFNLKKEKIICFFDGNKSAQRETQFEADDDWKERWIDLAEKKQPPLRNSVLIVKNNKVKPGSEWILKAYENHQAFEKWAVYY